MRSSKDRLRKRWEYFTKVGGSARIKPFTANTNSLGGRIRRPGLDLLPREREQSKFKILFLLNQLELYIDLILAEN